MPKPPRQLTLTDIARLAGVGLATASRALNGAPGVSPRTRQRVEDIAAQHHYVISPAASGLAVGQTRRIGVVVPHLSRWFFGELVEGLQPVLSEAELDLVLYGVGNRADRQKFFEQLPVRRNVDGIVVVGFLLEAHERQRLELLGLHIVATGGQDTSYPSVCVDDLAAGRRAMTHLADLGHRRIGTIEAHDSDLDEQPHLRRRAWEQVTRERRLESDPDLRRASAWDAESGALAMEDLLGLGRRPTAVYCHSDEVAAGALRTIRRAGLSVPDDISVIGIDDHPIASALDLTTVRQPVRAQGAAAATMIVDLLSSGATADPVVVLPTELVVRSSTGPPDRSTRSAD